MNEHPDRSATSPDRTGTAAPDGTGSTDRSSTPAPAGTAGGTGERGPAADEPPGFGPGGYLPDRAARRARKIVLRAPLGIQWVVGALVAGALVLIAGLLFLRSGDTPPPDPWVEVAPLEQISATRSQPEIDALVVTVAGRVRTFAASSDVTYCTATGRLVDADGGVWTVTGRGLADTPSLEEHPTLLSAGVVYVDPSRTVAGPPSSDEPADATCP